MMTVTHNPRRNKTVPDVEVGGTSARRLSDLSITISAPEKSRHSLGLVREDSATTSFSATSKQLSKLVVEASRSSWEGRLKEKLQSTTLGQLRLSDLKLHGREDVLTLLEEKLASIGKDMKQGPIVVAGVSGVGKTALVERGLERPAQRRGMAFVGGKFDLYNNALPYSAFAEALARLAKHVASHPNAAKIKGDVLEALGEDDSNVILEAMQDCDGFFDMKGRKRHRRQSFRLNQTVGKDAVSRMQFAIRRLMKAVCSNMDGVVLFIDDLQWSDSASLDLLQSLAQDEDIPSLLMVGAFRDDEVPEHHPLALRIKELERNGTAITRIELGNLEQVAVQNLVADVLDMEDSGEKVGPLAEIVHNKTNGNAFFVIFFLRSLYDEGLLQYNFGIASWHWDKERVGEKLMTENVSSMMIIKMQRFTKLSQHVIKVAACLGASFSKQTLEAALDDNEYSYDSSSMADTFNRFEDEGLWERDENDLDTYRFAHDEIQSAAYQMVPAERRESLKGDIGAHLMEKLDPDSLNRHLFEIVSLRNCAASSLSAAERMDLADLNLQAGIKASKNAAFDSAVIYYETARELWGQNAWKEDESISRKLIDLYTKEAQARFVVGHLDIMQSLIDELLCKDLPIQQVFGAYEVKILAAQAANDFDTAINVGLEVRRRLGFKAIPTKPSLLAILWEFRKTNKAFAGRSAEELASLPKLTDEKVIMGQRMLELLGTSSFQANQDMYPHVVFRKIQTMLKHGLNRSSCDGFSGAGILLSGPFGDPKRGREMGKAAELLAQNPEMKMMKSRVLFCVQALVYHHTSSLQGTLRPLLEGYQIGLRTGDTESACWSIGFRSCYLWFASCKLKDIVPEYRAAVTALQQMNQDAIRLCVMPYYQAAKNLSGEGVELDTDRPWLLKGTECNFDEALAFAKNTAKSTMLAAYIIIVQLDLFVIYQQWDAAKELLIKEGDLRKFVPGFFQGLRFTFLEGLISLKAAQTAASWMERRKWRRRAKKAMKIMRGRISKGNCNIVHTLQLLAAELHVLNGKTKEAEESYKQAQIGAKRAGFVNDSALAHELAVLHFLETGDEYWTKHNAKLAHEAYVDWQAKVKADLLQRQYPQYIVEE
mmetsp:Transcript_39577/g.95158  ORF Transcript_39577/g.95158 Transcript_39577/m.95158 type:complete len:1108 (-) Transcript_39577:206-3529(-)